MWSFTMIRLLAIASFMFFPLTVAFGGGHSNNAEVNKDSSTFMIFLQVSYICFLCMTFYLFLSGVKTEEIRKGRILVGLRDMWRVCLEIFPWQNTKEKCWKKTNKSKNNLRQTNKNYLFLMFPYLFSVWAPAYVL